MTQSLRPRIPIRTPDGPQATIMRGLAERIFTGNDMSGFLMIDHMIAVAESNVSWWQNGGSQQIQQLKPNVTEDHVKAIGYGHDLFEKFNVTPQTIDKHQQLLASRGVDQIVIEGITNLTELILPDTSRFEQLQTYYAKLTEDPLAREIKKSDIRDNTRLDRLVDLTPDDRVYRVVKYLWVSREYYRQDPPLRSSDLPDNIIQEVRDRARSIKRLTEFLPKVVSAREIETPGGLDISLGPLAA